jgi:fumarylacetoacetate (FAA) hydrolase
MVQIRNGRMPEWAESDPQLYQGGSDGFLGPRQDIPLRDSSWGLDFEAEIAVVTDHVPMGTEDQQASSHIKLLMLCNDVSLRNLTRAEREKGFGFFQSKPASAFSPVAVTPEELGNAWDGDTIHLPLVTTFNGSEFGRPNAGADRQFGFRWLIRHAAKTRDLGAGTIIGSGTVSNKDRSVGSSCIAERRMIETLQKGKPITDFMKSGDRVRIEMFDSSGASVFGAIDQQVA